MPDDRIKHIVVLMLENRSFDHMFGFYDPEDDDIDDLGGAESNPRPGGGKVIVSDTAGYKGLKDPGHHFPDVNEQIFGVPDPDEDAEPTMSGFVKNYARQPGVKPERAGDVMKCFSPDMIPVLTTLAQEFALCDAWFSSLPGPTLPNRAFAHCASSNGSVDMNPLAFVRLPTIYESLNEQDVSSKVYAFDGNSLAFAFPNLLAEADRYLSSYEAFLKDAKKGKLPAYSFLEPRYNNYFDNANQRAYYASDQHPPNDVRLGEELIADVYEAVRNSPLWEETLLVITYDEHGGLYDHVIPPDDVKAPDGKSDAVSGFEFTRLGLRVPALLISPYIEAGSVIKTRFEHASLAATARACFAPAAEPLTIRDEEANSFDSVLTLNAPRDDTPDALDRKKLKPPASPKKAGTGPLSDHQLSQVMVAYRLDELLPANKSVVGHDARFGTLADINTEQLAVEYIRLVSGRARDYWGA
jgi:phospholipase C